MSNPLFGMPSFGPAKKFLTDYAIRAGYCDVLPWADCVKLIQLDLKDLLDNGSLHAEKDPARGVVITNKVTHLTSDYRVCLSSQGLRFGRSKVSATLPAPVIKEVEAISAAKWFVNTQMAEWAVEIGPDQWNPMFADSADISLEAGGHHLPQSVAREGRTFHEGSLSLTGDKMTRFCQDTEEIPYTKADMIRIAPLLGVSTTKMRVKRIPAEAIVEEKGVDGFAHIRHLLWKEDVRLRGKSGAMVGCDIRTSGPLLGAICSGDLSLLQCTNIFGSDGFDCRNTVAGRVVMPLALRPYADRIIAETKKPLITQLFYGQSSGSGAEGLFWKDPEKAPVGWIRYGTVQEHIVEENRDKLNPDLLDIIDELGYKTAFRAFTGLSRSFNDTFWSSFPAVLLLRQKLEDAYDYHVKKHGVPPTLTMPNGFMYTHRKWELDPDGTTTRFRYEGPGSSKPLDITLLSVKDDASGFSLFVRMIHAMDAWFRNAVSLKIIRWQEQNIGKYVGHGTVHDNWIVPIIMLPVMHGIVRSVLHEAVNVLPELVNKFLRENGQEPMNEMPKWVLRKIHKSIRSNKAFLSLN